MTDWTLLPFSAQSTMNEHYWKHVVFNLFPRNSIDCTKLYECFEAIAALTASKWISWAIEVFMDIIISITSFLVTPDIISFHWKWKADSRLKCWAYNIAWSGKKIKSVRFDWSRNKEMNIATQKIESKSKGFVWSIRLYVFVGGFSCDIKKNID